MLNKQRRCSWAVPSLTRAHSDRLTCLSICNMQGRFWVNLSSLVSTQKSPPEHKKAEGEWTQIHLLNKIHPIKSHGHKDAHLGSHCPADHLRKDCILSQNSFSISLHQPKPWSLLHWNGSGKRHLFLHEAWQNIQVGAHGNLMHFQGTISLMYF